jgi:solute carrier family 8 (sodium/calcium exchanger)
MAGPANETVVISDAIWKAFRADECGDKGLLLPIIPYEGQWNVGVRAALYMAALLYCFMGVAIVADIFMGSIEKITSKTRKV